MSRPVAVLRPEPGNAASVAALRAAGLEAVALPLFQIVPHDWQIPDPRRFDGLLLTSANALRHGGDGLRGLRDLPVLAVGETTAAAARSAGFIVEQVGPGDVASLLDRIAPDRRLLWLAGADRTMIAHPAIVDTIAGYEAAAVPIPHALVTALHGHVVMLHSTRAAARFAWLIDRAGMSRLGLTLVTISTKVADAAGRGWASVQVAEAPTDAAMIASARTVAIDP